MSSPSTAATIIFAVFAFGFIGVLLAGAFILDKRRVKDVHEAIPERSEGAFDQPRRDETPTGPVDGYADGGGVVREPEESGERYPNRSVGDPRRGGE